MQPTQFDLIRIYPVDLAFMEAKVMRQVWSEHNNAWNGAEYGYIWLKLN